MAEITLTEEQRAVVENRGGSLLVSAAAGSGKTKVLVERLFRYIMEEGRNIDDFLIITYTRAAAAELRSKIAGELSRRLAEQPEDRHLRSQLLRVYQADIRTVDAFCTGLLRENAHLLAREEDDRGLSPDFRVLDENEARLLRERVLDRTLERFYDAIDEGGQLLADTLGFGKDDRALAALVLELYEKVQSHAWRSEWLADNGRRWADMAQGGVDFDETPYAKTLLTGIARRSGHWAVLLASAAQRVEGDEGLSRGYGERFLAAAFGLEQLSKAADWTGAQKALAEVTFPRLATPKGRKDDPDALRMKKLWEGAKEEVKRLNGLLNIDGGEAMEDLAAAAPAMEALVRLTASFSEDYRKEKLRLNAADFSDQEHLALKILTDRDRTPTELGRQVAARYQEILVDEYQDTNEVQNAIFRAVSRDGKNLFTVGDVKQSIYRFRLADPTIFLEKYGRFKPWTEAEEGEERKILLSKNFRSRQEVLDAANFVFSNILSKEMGEMDYGEDEALHFGAEYYPEHPSCDVEFHLIRAQQRRGGSGAPAVKRLTAEARFAAARARRLLDEGFLVTEADGTLRPCRPEDIVILMRSPGGRAAAYAAALAEQGIPCALQESGEFFETMEVSTMLSMLEIIDNPRQDVPLIAVLRSPVFGFTPDRLAVIRGAAPEGDFYDAAAADGGEDCAAFLSALSEFRLLARDLPVCQLLWHVYNTLNVLGVFGAMEDGRRRRENLIALAEYAEKIENSGYRGLFPFITQLRRLIETGRAPQARSASESGGVRIMSIHKSKGLEFPVVILADLDHSFSVQDFQTPVLVHPALGLGPVRVDLKRKIKYPTLARKALEETLSRENKAEEQRVLYVAMTRAKEKLILVSAMYFSETRLKRLLPQASCPALPESVAAGHSFADWLLLPLLCRPEAAPLRELADMEAGDLYTGDTAPWRVEVHEAADYAMVPSTDSSAPEANHGEAAFDPSLLEFVYPHQAETALPAKLTATQLKGREVDQEIAEEAAAPVTVRPLTRPRFRQERVGLTAAEGGTATHLVLQYLDFSNLDVAEQTAELKARRLLTEEQATAVRVTELRRFLCSELAEELRRSPEIKREYPFTVLLDAREVDPSAAEGEEILLQGIVDCCFLQPDGSLAVVDFKTDHVYGEALRERAEQYRPQLTAYSAALERVLEKKVTRRVLYFLLAGEAVEL